LVIITPHFLSLAANTHGTRVLQKLLDFIKTEKLISKFSEIIQDKVYLSKDMNGNHIIQKFVTLMISNNVFIFDAIMEDFYDTITDKHGCCVLQKCLEVADINYKNAMIDLVIENTVHYMSDQYANYVMQYIISLNDHKVNRRITESYLSSICLLSKHKFSSNVIEKVFDHSDDITKEMMVKHLNDSIIIQALLFDMYGNYVVQKAFSAAKEPYYSAYVKTIYPLMEKLRSVPFGPKLYNKFLSFSPELSYLIGQKNGIIINSNVHNNPRPFDLSRSNIHLAAVSSNRLKIPNNNFMMNSIIKNGKKAK